LQIEKPQRQETAGTVSRFRFAGTSRLELELAAVRRELFRLQNDYLKLGLRASLLVAERDTALKNFDSTQAYLAAVRPDFKAPGQRRYQESVPGAATVSAGPGESGVTRPAAAVRAVPRWRRAVAALARRTLPAGQLAGELSALRRELATLRNDFSSLERHADGLARERDAILEDLQRLWRDSTPVEQQPRAAVREPQAAVVDPAARLKVIDDTLKRVQVEKNDIEIRLAERDAELAQLQSEREQAAREFASFDERLSTAEREVLISRDANAALVSQLASLGNELDKAQSRDAEQLAALAQRVEQLETALEQARRARQELQSSRDAAQARNVYVEEQRQRLRQELEEHQARLVGRESQLGELHKQQQQQRARAAELEQQLEALARERATLAESNRSLTGQLEAEQARGDEREQQIAELQQCHEQLREKANALGESLSVAEREQRSVSAENQSLVSALETLKVDVETEKNQARERIAWLEQRFAELEPILERAHREREAIELSLQEAKARRADAEQQRQRLIGELEQQREKLGDRDLQLVELQAQKERLRVEFEALGQALRGVEKERADAGEENRSLVDNLRAVLGEYASTRHRDHEQIAGLERQLAELEPQLSAANLQIDTLELSLSEASDRLEVAGKRINALELQLPKHEANQSEPLQPELSHKPAPQTLAARHHRHFSWTTAVAGFVFLLGVLGSAAKIWDVYNSDNERAVAGKGIQPAEESSTAKSIASLERAAGPAESVEIPAQNQLQTPQAQTAGVEPDSGEHSDDAEEVADHASKPKPENAGGPLVEAYLMQPDTSAHGSTGPCADAAKGGEPCAHSATKLSGDAVIELPGGVKYSVIRNGTGRAPGPGDTVLISYRGSLPDGTGFDSARDAGGAEAFRLSDAIPGLQDVLQYMEEGAKWEVYVPAELAFKKPGPYSGQDVIFVIELKAVTTPDAGHVGELSSWRVSKTAVSDFAKDNAGSAGVVTLPSGLRYKVLKSGNADGRRPQPTDRVSLRYRGLLPDGRVFDSSGNKGGEVTFALRQLIPGWREALLKMAEGARWELYIPPALAVPEGGVSKRGVPDLKPLIYDIELVSIK
jgi:FKBP-type peptidyl-prolyl cis-trans isomerase/predicted  nucleic acid-binding Zn-ribbon protein